VGGLESKRLVVSLLDSPKEDVLVSILLVATLCNLYCYFVLKNYFFLRLSLPVFSDNIKVKYLSAFKIKVMNWCSVKKCFV